jgi:16S rRNA (guanine527-N7)-methyltransferase
MYELINKYFPGLTEKQNAQFKELKDLYAEWNQMINVISRKDIDNLYERHVLHSLGICKMIGFKAGSKVMDIGTGGGFPGIPLAIMYPETHFHLVDSIGKKLKVASGVAESIGLTNVSVRHCRAEDEKGMFDFVVSRAVMPLPDLIKICRKNISKTSQLNSLPNGLICLKGGDLQAELKPYSKIVTEINLKDYFKEEFFETKKVIYLPL